MLQQRTIEIIKSTVPVLQVHGEAITSRFYEMLFQKHPELLNIFNHANQKKGRQQAALANAVYAAAANIDKLETIIPVVKGIAHKHRSLGVKREHYPVVGENLLLAIKDVLGDAATDEVINAWAEAYGVIADVFIGIESNMYEEAGWEGFRPFIVTRKIEESSVITSFYLEPQDKIALAKFKPGQYVSIKMDIPGQINTHIRQYSLSDAPGQSSYRISVKKESGTDTVDGMVSVYLHERVKEGDILHLSAPAGDFYLNTDSEKHVVLISGGVGLTPMVSMLKTVASEQPERKVTFVHAAINGQTHALKEEVIDIAEASDHITTHFVYESPLDEDLGYTKRGYIDQTWLKEILPLNDDADYYFCGPIPFMQVINAALQALNVPKENIHFEFFGPASDLQKEIIKS